MNVIIHIYSLSNKHTKYTGLINNYYNNNTFVLQTKSDFKSCSPAQEPPSFVWIVCFYITNRYTFFIRKKKWDKVS